MVKAFIVLLLFSLAPVLSGCNTTKGMGKDMQQTGQNIQQTVDKNQ